MLLCCVCVRGCQESFKHGGTSAERLSHASNGSLVGKFHLSTFNIVSVLSTSLAVTCVVRQKCPVRRAWPFCASLFAYNPLPVCAKPDRKAWPSCASSFAYNPWPVCAKPVQKAWPFLRTLVTIVCLHCLAVLCKAQFVRRRPFLHFCLLFTLGHFVQSQFVRLGPFLHNCLLSTLT